MSLRVTVDNFIQYRFYEIPTTSSVCLQADTVLGKNGLVQSLVEEVKKRMLNISLDMPMSTRCWILDEFAQKLVNSGQTCSKLRRRGGLSTTATLPGVRK